MTKRKMEPRKTMRANQNKEVEIFVDEAHMFHLLLVTKENDPVKKEYVERKVVQSFSPIDFRSMKGSGFFSQYDNVLILHNPDENEVDDQGNLITGNEKKPEAEKDSENKKAADDDAELAELRKVYAELHGVEAPKDIPAQTLAQMNYERRGALIEERAAAIKPTLAAVSEKDLKSEYKKVAGKAADAIWDREQLVDALAMQMAMKGE